MKPVLIGLIRNYVHQVYVHQVYEEQNLDLNFCRIWKFGCDKWEHLSSV